MLISRKNSLQNVNLGTYINIILAKSKSVNINKIIDVTINLI